MKESLVYLNNKKNICLKKSRCFNIKPRNKNSKLYLNHSLLQGLNDRDHHDHHDRLRKQQMKPLIRLKQMLVI